MLGNVHTLNLYGCNNILYTDNLDTVNKLILYKNKY
jgi:hypothetical protein